LVERMMAEILEGLTVYAKMPFPWMFENASQCRVQELNTSTVYTSIIFQKSGFVALDTK
jgi:hypothetical protein